MLAFGRMREAPFLGDRNKIAELMNLHRATLRCERRFVEVLVSRTLEWCSVDAPAHCGNANALSSRAHNPP